MCKRRGRVWSCHDENDSDSPVIYRLHVNSHGCWSGRVVEDENVKIHDGFGLGRTPRRISDCIGIFDYVRFWQRLL